MADSKVSKVVSFTATLVTLSVFYLTASRTTVAGQPAITAEGYTCSRNISSLQELQPISSDSEEGFTMCISMPAGTHYVNYTSTPIAYSVVMMGNNATIRCTPGVALNNSDYNDFPFIFQNSSVVRLENVHFRDCLRPVMINEVLSVQLVNATFSNFHPAGALEILNSPTVIAEGCRFTNNTSLGIGTAQYSGNAGGIAIGYNNLSVPQDTEKIAISISQSVFVENTANVTAGFNRTTGEVLANRTYNQRGGGIAFYFGTDGLSAEVDIDRCDFEGNVANSAGGGVYMYLTGEDNAHTVRITETNFTLNKAQDGGGLEITFDTSISVENPNDIFVADCKFSRNKGNFGGGFKSIQLNSHGNQNKVTMVNCEFTENDAPVGSGIYFQSRFTIITVAMDTRIVLRDCNFTDNIANRGVLFLTRNTVELQGTNLFIGNIGPSIRVVNSLLSIRDGDVWFINNRRHDEGFSGQLYLSSFGQLLLHRNSNLTFINNTGSEGACIVVNGQSITREFSHQLYNPQCFMVYEDPTIQPPQWEVTMTFIENGAMVGPVIFLTDFESCDWYSLETPYFADNSPNTTWSFMDIRDNYVIRDGARGQERRYEPEYGIQTEIHRLQLINSTITVHASPGDPIVVTAVALDQLEHNTSAFLEITADSETNGPLFQPGIVQTQAGVGKINFTYFSANTSGNTTVLLRASFTPLQIAASELILVHEDCLPGYFFSADQRQCLCEETKEIILCETNRQGILLDNGLWGAPPNWSRTLVTIECPAGYCNCTGGRTAAEGSVGCLLVYDNPFLICHETRKGILCGKCHEDYGLGLLTTKCRLYKGKVPEYYWLVPIYVVLVIPTLILIVKLGIKFPPVLKGFLLYIQFAPIAVAFLPQFFDLRQDVMACLASALSFYFPYDFKFHEGLTALKSYGLRYIAVLFAVTVVPIAMRIKYRSKNWHGVWTIILLMYVMTTETSISLLFCPTLHRTVNGERIITTIWFFDGNVECYQGVHLLLTIISVAVLILLGMLIPLVALIIYYDKITYKFPIFDRLERCSKAITRGIKPQFKWWPIQELIIRYVFVIAVVLSPGLRTLPLALSLVIVTLHTFVHPYMDWKANYTESLVMVTLVIILALGNTSPLVERTRNVKQFTLWPLLYLPVIVGAGYVLVLFTYLFWKWLSSQKDEWFSRKEESTDNDRRLTLSLSALHRAWRFRTVTTTTVSFTDTEADDGDDDDDDDHDDDGDSDSR